jgi:3-oxoacyl-[acyl-carrier-protein] synthase-1
MTTQDAVAVTAMGMVSAIGHDVVASAAAARAGLNEPRPLEVMLAAFGKETRESRPKVAGHAVPGIGTGFAGAGKVIALGAAALRDLLSRRPLGPRELSAASIHLALSDQAILDAHHASTTGTRPSDDPGPPPRLPSVEWQEKSRRVIERLLRTAEIDVPERHRALVHGGNPGVADALRDAAALLRSGAVDRCLVGAIDSRVEPSFLLAADGLGVLRTNENPVGLIPGEAAAFVLLERAVDAQRHGIEALALLAGTGAAREPGGHFGDAPSTGRALSQACLSVLGGTPTFGGALSWMIGDLNGTERRAAEWGNALLRMQHAGVSLGVPLWLPAWSFGDVGAASGAVAVCLAVRAFQRGYAPGPGVLIWLSSESGAAAALGLTTARG